MMPPIILLQLTCMEPFHLMTPKVAVLEGQIAVRPENWLGEPGQLSEQQLLDCMENVSCHRGNWPKLALEYTGVHGIASGRDYPYRGPAGDCNFQSNYPSNVTYPAVFRNIDFERTSFVKQEEELKKLVAAYGPVGVTLTGEPLKYVKPGEVLESESCLGFEVNHAVVIVGYGTQPVNHWIVVSTSGISCFISSLL